MAREVVEFPIAGRMFAFEAGEVGGQAHGAVIGRVADTVVFVAAVNGRDLDNPGFVPLSVDYRERMSAAGKIPGGFWKREGRPTPEEVLTMRMIDRPLRSQFPKGYQTETVITALVLSCDQENAPDVMAVNAASAALYIAGAPIYSPIGAVRVGRIGNDFVAFPSNSQLQESTLDLVVCCNREGRVVMLEGCADEAPPSVVADAIGFAKPICQRIIEAQENLAEKVGRYQLQPSIAEIDEEIYATLKERFYQKLYEANFTTGKIERRNAVNAVLEEALQQLVQEEAEREEEERRIREAFSQLERRVVRDAILKEGRRCDGRSPTDLRPINAKVGVLPRTHGSALFTKGHTQALVTVTLGTVTDAQLIDGLLPEFFKKFMLHYNFPAFCVGETWPYTGPKRREIGHGALAERALEPMIPPEEEFPYTIRVVSDIMESDGSSSMATVCGGTLAMMDAGIPIKRPVAGVSIGLVWDDDNWVTLTDICGVEDFCGDMDFKIASTTEGITAIQMDTKATGLTDEIVEKALQQAYQANKVIVEEMLSRAGLEKPRDKVSVHAPKIAQITISPEKVGLVIGSSGRTVRKIQSDTGTLVEIDETGKVTISGPTEEAVEAAKKAILQIVADVELGKIYTGKVVGLRSFGVLVEVVPGREGMCHISELSDGYIKNAADYVKVGDEIPVKVIGFDDFERPRLSRRLALKELGQEETWATPTRRESPPRRDRPRHHRRDDNRRL